MANTSAARSPSRVEADVCIVGAGPHGLAAAVHLLRADPDLRLTVLDPSGDWLTGWHDQFARAEIATLRSPMVHHPAPDPYELADFVASTGADRSGLPYNLPTTEAFASFCRHLIDSMQLPSPLQRRPRSIEREGRRVRVTTSSEVIDATHFIVATNPHRRSVPEWAWTLLGRRAEAMRYGADVDLRTLDDLSGERIVVVGGGLSAGHLAYGAAKRGAEVSVVARRPLRSQPFDTEPGWLGPKYLRSFEDIDSPRRRLDTIGEARNGGSMPPWMRERLDTLADAGQVRLHERCRVRAAGFDAAQGRFGAEQIALALDDHSTLCADRVWLATGTSPDIRALRPLRGLLPDVPILDGVPVTGQDLRLGPHPVHVMGRLAGLELGPAAGNLWGAQRAASRITAAVTGVDFDRKRITEKART